MSKIILVTGEKQAGKSTRLFNSFNKNDYAGGIIMPIVNGKRFFYSFSKNEFWEAETDEKETNLISIGKFLFSENAFKKANEIIEADIGKKAVIIIDEIGPLEMGKKRGLLSSLHLAFSKLDHIRFLVLVVRPVLLPQLEALCKTYSQNTSIISITKENSLD